MLHCNLSHLQIALPAFLCLFPFLALTGCAPKPASSSATPEPVSVSDEPQPAPNAEPRAAVPESKPRFEAVTLGDDPSDASSDPAGAAADNAKLDNVVAGMQPLQIMLGRWRGTTNQKFKGFSAVEELEWVWDFKTNRDQPALVLTSDKSPYIREARLTYLPAADTYQLVATNPEGQKRTLEGTFERDPEEFTGDDNRPQQSYKLVLKEVDAQTDEAWQIAFDQQENNRYLVQVFRKRGMGSFQLADTVGTQRLGTSFAQSDEDYGDRKCIISGGLGTNTVSFNGKTYWVCCSGCLAAFNEDPARWVAKREKSDKSKTEN